MIAAKPSHLIMQSRCIAQVQLFDNVYAAYLRGRLEVASWRDFTG